MSGLFGITVDQLLTVDDKLREPAEVYRKVVPGNAVKLLVEDDDVEEASEEELDTEAELSRASA